jgi:hypothetical protein
MCVNPGATIDGGIHMTMERSDDQAMPTHSVSQEPSTR